MITHLEQEYNKYQQESQAIKEKVLQYEIILKRAQTIFAGLSQEGERWKNELVAHREKKENCLGDTILAMSCFFYLNEKDSQEWSKHIDQVKTIVSIFSELCKKFNQISQS